MIIDKEVQEIQWGRVLPTNSAETTRHPHAEKNESREGS